MTLRAIPHLMFDGNAKEAIQFYEEVLDAKVLSIQTYGEIPEFPGMSFPEKILDLVAHARLKVGETDIAIYDSPGFSRQIGNQAAIYVTTSKEEKTKQIFEALQQDGKVIGPLEETSFTPAQGYLMDKFGVTFTIVTDAQN
ncbi:VOC family protein [Virgibacillus litoralis]|uniref:PhnB protein n=1 Tax=Virgibacillus litoralis TaxID=578221 RepID=A0ABS4H9B1_9BACI|nr:VOC family protein [Virgibacillus litoralis]MBP1947498.1 PhnB protein [Virgibacillus litoralis]